MRFFVAFVFVVSFGALVGLTYGGYIAPWTGRFYSLWDTGYARKHIPIISSVSEHQPPAWPAFFFDLQMLIWLFPAGIYLLFRELKDEHVFVIIYAVMASYFASVMVRLMLTLTPVVCVSAAIAISSLLDTYLDPQEPEENDEVARKLAGSTNGVIASTTSEPKSPKSGKGKKGAAQQKAATAIEEPAAAMNGDAHAIDEAHRQGKPWAFRTESKILGIYGLDSRAIVAVYTLLLLLIFVLHSTFVTSTAYSSPSIVLATRNPDGSQHIIDDFREAYYWLKMNTAQDAKIMSWWDYGYQIAGYSDRTTLVDNNTWNNTHIATVGKAMSVSEAKAYPILRQHDVDYVLVMFGGLLGYSGDDMNKFLWMIRISQGIWPDEVKEADFFTPQGQYKIDDGATKTMRESLMYKMSYYKFNDLFGSGKAGQDRVRGTATATVGPELDYLDEAFTSENWIVSRLLENMLAKNV